MTSGFVRWPLAGAVAALAAAQLSVAAVEFPNAPGKDVAQRVCASCHDAGVVIAKGRTRGEWAEVIASMVSRGAKGSEEEFARVLDYLSTNFPQGKTVPSAVARPADKVLTKAESIAAGREVYNAQCVQCHGERARGEKNGVDLVRSVVVLHDREGSELGPFLRKGHPTMTGTQSAKIADASLTDLSRFLRQQVDDTLRSGPFSKPINVLTGDAKAGEAYFNGEGKCNTCHSPTGDMKGIAGRFDPVALQQRFLFPMSGGFRQQRRRTLPVTVTVTPASGQAVTGTLVTLDDFNVSLRDASGEYRSWDRTPGLKVEKHNPYAAHIEMLDRYKDKDIHDVVAYLETLK